MSDMYHKLFVDAGHDEGGAFAALAAMDADIKQAIDRFGTPPDRALPARFGTLARAIVGQQVSRAAATAIWNRLEGANLSDERAISRCAPAELMEHGLSGRKAEYLIGLAMEITSGSLDLASLSKLPGPQVRDRLTKLRGIGDWTADNYRLFALADMDAWPVNDIALQEGMKLLKSLDERPDAKALATLGECWRPYRGAGALVLWHIYGVLVRKVTVADI